MAQVDAPNASPSSPSRPDADSGENAVRDPEQSYTNAPVQSHEHDTGTLAVDWSQALLSRYNSELSTLDAEEESLLNRLSHIQTLQAMWSAAGRQSEMDRSNKRIKTCIAKVLLEDDRLSKKRKKLNGVMAAVQDLVGLLDDNESNSQTAAGI